MVIRSRDAVRSVAALLSSLFLLLLFFQVAVLDTGALAAAVAFAAGATAAAGSAIAVCLLIAARCAPVVAPTRVRTAMRDRERRTAFLPQRDPDAKGRTRPRAPGCVLRTTSA